MSAYGSDQLTGDLGGLLDHFGYRQAAFTGHDWGSMVVWEMGRLHPDRVSSIYNLSVPLTQSPAPPLEIFELLFAGKFFYILYFQQVGPPEAELEADPRTFLRNMLYAASGDALWDSPAFVDRPREGTGMLDTLTSAPDTLPSWISEEDVDVYAEAFARSGFFGPAELLPQHGRQLGAEQGHSGVGAGHAHRVPHRIARSGQPDVAGCGRGDAGRRSRISGA